MDNACQSSCISLALLGQISMIAQFCPKMPNVLAPVPVIVPTDMVHGAQLVSLVMPQVTWHLGLW